MESALKHPEMVCQPNTRKVDLLSLAAGEFSRKEPSATIAFDSHDPAGTVARAQAALITFSGTPR